MGDIHVPALPFEAVHFRLSLAFHLRLCPSTWGCALPDITAWETASPPSLSSAWLLQASTLGIHNWEELKFPLSEMPVAKHSGIFTHACPHICAHTQPPPPNAHRWCLGDGTWKVRCAHGLSWSIPPGASGCSKCFELEHLDLGLWILNWQFTLFLKNHQSSHMYWQCYIGILDFVLRQGLILIYWLA